MDFITLDFETFYDSKQGYTLRKLTTEEYIRDPRFEAIMVGIKVNDQPARSFVGPAVEMALHACDFEQHAVICHHAHFDAAILNWHYGIRPKAIFDTLPMARAAIGSVDAGGLSLGAIARHLQLGEKELVVAAMDGRHLEDMSPTELQAYIAYNAESPDSDVNLTYRIFRQLVGRFTSTELKLMDLTCRLFTEPMLELDGDLYAEFKEQEIARKATLILQAGVLKEELMSNPKFAAVLERLGVKPPMKYSPTRVDEKGAPVLTYAFAKDDDGLVALLDHPDDTVRAVVEARMGVKSSIMETRAQRFMEMAPRGACPIYLKYWGAEQTGRPSASDKTNFLNLGRTKMLTSDHLALGVSIITPSGRAQVAKLSRDGTHVLTTRGVHDVKDCHQVGLRDGLRAPAGHKIVVGDSSNIEARMVVYIAGQEDMVHLYRDGGDPYCDLAASIFGRTITKKDNPAERQLGKVGVLQLGFQSGADKFFDTVRHWDFGPDAAAMRPYQNDEHLIRSIVPVFRNKYYRVQWTWDDYRDRVIPALSKCTCVFLDRKGLLHTTERGTILLPNGGELRYPHLRWVEDKEPWYPPSKRNGQWQFDVREGSRLVPTKLYGGKLFENVVQAMARVVVMDQTVRVAQRYRVVHSVYDEVVCCVPEDQAQECEAYIKECLITPPAWAPDLPLAAETGTGDFYGAAK